MVCCPKTFRSSTCSGKNIMKLEFESTFISDALHEELDFDQYLSLFYLNIPILPSRILKPMGKTEGLDYYGKLVEIENRLRNRNVDEMVELSGQLPRLDTLLPLYEAGELEQYHLFELGSFLTADTSLAEKEKDAPLDPGGRIILGEMLALLRKRTTAHFSVMAASDEDAALSSALDTIEADLTEKISEYEQQIADQTGLKMIYPWPKEIAFSRESLKQISSCSLISVKQKNDIWLIDYRPGEDILSLKKERDRLTEEFEAVMSEKLARLNSELRPFFKSFAGYYGRRKERTWSYLMIAVKRRNDLTFPVFTSSSGCRVEQGYLWGLQLRKKEHCIPLDLELRSGSNVLYGANMSGKTTVLKTLYFLFSLIQCGLPVPAEAVTMNYPEYVSIMLKSSGNIKQDISAFGEEISFFTRDTSDGAYILADELFLSTDPVNGAALSEIIIEEFSQKNMIFFCTTHYPDVLALQNIALLRMLDIDPETLSKRGGDIDVLREKMPYRLEKVVNDDSRRALQHNKKPLEIALLFPLPMTVKERIQLRLNEKDNE